MVGGPRLNRSRKRGNESKNCDRQRYCCLAPRKIEAKPPFLRFAFAARHFIFQLVHEYSRQGFECFGRDETDRPQA
jgi:hypothetical protein